jgi:exosortase A
MDLSRPDLQTWQVSSQRNAAIALIALVLIALALYGKTVASLFSLWTRPFSGYHHGIVLVGISAVLLYRRWVELGPSLQVRPSLSAALPVLVTSLAWFLASLVDVLIVQQVSLLLLFSLLVVAVVGYRSAWRFAFPVFLLVFAVPVWDPLVPYLQSLVANVTTVLLNLTGIPALLQGTQISIPAGTFEVEPACSGVSQLIVATMAGALFAYVNRLGWKTAIWILGAAAGVSLLTNLLRIYVTVVIGQVSGMQHYFVTEHWAPGWVLFGIGMFVLFFLIDRWTSPGDHAPSTGSAQKTGDIVPVNIKASVVRTPLLSVIALAVGPALVYVYQADRREVGRLELNFPAEIAGWRAAPAASEDYRPSFQGPELEYEGLYRDDQAHQVYLYVAKYTQQEQGKEAVSAANSVYDEETWRPGLTRTVRLSGGATVRETRLESRTGAEKLVWQWYYVHGFAVGTGYMAKLLNAWGALNRDPAITAIVVATDRKYGDDSSEATAVLVRFVTDTQQALEWAIDRSPEPQRSSGPQQ